MAETASDHRRRRRSGSRDNGIDISVRVHDRLALTLFAAAVIVLVLGGGSNRTDVASLLYVRPMLVLLLGCMLLIVDRQALRTVRWPLSLMGFALALAIIQLIPLPPGLWTALPGRTLMKSAATAQGLPQPWRPISLTPDLTIQAILWFLAPASGIVGWAVLPSERRGQVLIIVVILSMASAVLGALQVSQGVGSSLYLYRRTYEGNAVGFLANRNHQGTLLALTFPLLRVWTLLPSPTRQGTQRRLTAAATCSVILIPVILLTASRAGMGLSLLGLMIAVVIAPWRDVRTLLGKAGRYVLPALIACGVAVFGVVVLFGRALAFDRWITLDTADDLRFRFIPQVLKIVWEYFPVGSGLGSFDPVFRIFEPDRILRPTTYNHAHDDFLEVVLTAGLPGMLLMVAGLAWWAFAGWQVFRDRSRIGVDLLLGRAGWSSMLILILASIVDYPLRTPLLGFVFAVAAAWLAAAVDQEATSRFALQKFEPALGESGKAGSFQESNL